MCPCLCLGFASLQDPVVLCQLCMVCPWQVGALLAGWGYKAPGLRLG